MTLVSRTKAREVPVHSLFLWLFAQPHASPLSVVNVCELYFNEVKHNYDLRGNAVSNRSKTVGIFL